MSKGKLTILDQRLQSAKGELKTRQFGKKKSRLAAASKKITG
jgi:hypothetical protein